MELPYYSKNDRLFLELLVSLLTAAPLTVLVQFKLLNLFPLYTSRRPVVDSPTICAREFF